MPKPSTAELLTMYPPAITEDPGNAMFLPLDTMCLLSDATAHHLGQKRETGGMAIHLPSHEFQQTLGNGVHASDDLYQDSSLSSSPCPSLSYSLSSLSTSEPGSRAPTNDVGSSDWSDDEFDQSALMTTARDAQEVSLVTGSFCAVVTLNPSGLVAGDPAVVDGMILRGYLNGDPIYHKHGGLYTELLNTLTYTAYGHRHVTQPVETCFGHQPSNTMQPTLPAEPTANPKPSPASEPPATSETSTTSEPTAKSEPAAASELAAPPEPTAISEPLVMRSLADAVPKIQTPLQLRDPPNRTFHNEWFKVAVSPLGGFGVFAVRDIPKMTDILLEEPFFRLREGCELHTKYEKLPAEEKWVYDSLHGHSSWEKEDEVMKKWKANCFEVGSGPGALFAIASNFNHACHDMRSVQYHYDRERRVMVFTTDRDVSRGEELLISYDNRNNRKLWNLYGFVCQCGGCDGVLPKEEQIW